MAAHAKLKGRYGAHSIRIGRATLALKAGLSLEQICSIDDWKSDAVHLYLRPLAVVKLEVSSLMGL